MALSHQLERYASSLGPSGDITSKAKQIIHRIQTVLHREMREFSIDRVRPLGSLSKKTCLWFKMDIDIVVYFNNQAPPYADVKEELHQVIKGHLDSNCKLYPKALSFTVDEFEVDLLPAVNTMYGIPNVMEGARFESAQTDNIRDYMMSRGDEIDHSDFSTSLSEDAVEFQQNHSEFSRSLSRLAKFWSLTIGIPGFSYGRSTIMEYLGAKAAEEEEGRRSRDFLRGFQRFLEMVENPRGLNVYWTTFYRKDQIPRYILEQRPLLLDPSNPYNNILSGQLLDYFEQMSPYATTTISRLRSAQQDGRSSLVEIFKPQPSWCEIFREMGGKVPTSILISKHRGSSSLLPDIRQRFRGKDISQRSSIVMNYLCAYSDVVASVAKFRAEMGLCTRDDIVDTMQTELKQLMVPNGTWVSSNEKHTDKDTTLTIPAGKDGDDVIEISFNWN